MDVIAGYKESWVPKNWCLWTVLLEKTLESPLDCKGNQEIRLFRKSVLNSHWKDWCLSWNSNTLATWCRELTHLKRPWCWERLRAGGEGNDRRWDVWRASLTQWTWVWVNSGSWWWTGRPGVLQSMGLQRVRLDWATEVYLYCNSNCCILGLSLVDDTIDFPLYITEFKWLVFQYWFFPLSSLGMLAFKFPPFRNILIKL